MNKQVKQSEISFYWHWHACNLKIHFQLMSIHIHILVSHRYERWNCFSQLFYLNPFANLIHIWFIGWFIARIWEMKEAYTPQHKTVNHNGFLQSPSVNLILPYLMSARKAFWTFSLFAHLSPSIVNWLSSPIFTCSVVCPAIVTPVQISLLVAPHPQTHTFSESLW